MRYAVSLAPFGEASDPRLLVELAREAEAAGWDGFFLWDHLNWSLSPGIADPWVALAACATVTSRIHLGTMVTPLFRERPVTLARTTATLQRLCGGRLILGVGLGSPDPHESAYVGEEARLDVRARMTDEALKLLRLLWSGKPVTFRGEFYRCRTSGLVPVPEPIPVWVAATHPFKPGPLRRAAAGQGIVPALYADRDLTPEEIGQVAGEVARLRGGPGEVVFGVEERDRLEDYAAAGVTWWLEPLNDWVGDFAEQRRRLRAGPTRPADRPR